MVLHELSNYQEAIQVAAMINAFNRWRRRFSYKEILHSNYKYFIVKISDKVIACAAICEESHGVFKIQHVCVLPEYRGLCIAKNLLMSILNIANPSYVYMTIREDNISSLKMAASIGFCFNKKLWSFDHFIYIVDNRKGEL